MERYQRGGGSPRREEARMGEKRREEKRMKEKMTKLEKYWILYDVGNSAFVLLVSTILPIYFNALAGQGGVSEVDALAYWGYAMSVSTLLVAFI